MATRWKIAKRVKQHRDTDFMVDEKVWDSEYPYCDCSERRLYRLPCEHFCLIFSNIPGLDWEKLRWLDWIFLRGYLPSLSINYVATSKDMGKKINTTVLCKDENFFWSGFYCNRSRHGNVTTPLRFLFSFVFLCTKSFFKKSLKGVCTSIMAKFEEILWERFRNILNRSFKHHKNSEIACYPHN